MSGISILRYHQIGHEKPIRDHWAHYCTARQFSRQMALLAYSRCQVLRLSEAVAALRGQCPIPPRAVVLSFDGAYTDFISQVLPVLRRYRFPAIVYTISGWLGQRMRVPDSYQPRPWIMEARALRLLRHEGIEIGSQTLNHVQLPILTPHQQAEELRISREVLEQILGEPVTHLCYPFGELSPHTVELAQEAGYQTAVTRRYGQARSDDNLLLLPRKMIHFDDSVFGFGAKLFLKHHATKPQAV